MAEEYLEKFKKEAMERFKQMCTEERSGLQENSERMSEGKGPLTETVQDSQMEHDQQDLEEDGTGLDDKRRDDGED